MNEHYSLVSFYLDGLLSPEESRTFQSQLERDAALRHEVALERMIRTTIGEDAMQYNGSFAEVPTALLAAALSASSSSLTGSKTLGAVASTAPKTGFKLFGISKLALLASIAIIGGLSFYLLNSQHENPPVPVVKRATSTQVQSAPNVQSTVEVPGQTVPEPATPAANAPTQVSQVHTAKTPHAARHKAESIPTFTDPNIHTNLKLGDAKH